MKHFKAVLFFVFTIILAGCGSDKPVEKFFFEMGTIVQVTIEEKKQDDYYKITKYMKELTEKLNNDQLNIAESPVGKKIPVSKEFVELYKKAENYYTISNGLYDPTSITVSSLYGFPDKEFGMPNLSELNAAKQNAGFKNIELAGNKIIKHADTMIDLSANSKGYIIDKTVSFMKKEGFKNFIVNAGGDLYAQGLKYSKNPYKISIQDPDKENGIASIIKLTNKAVATSGNYERFFIAPDNRRITHIFSGIDFESSNNYKSVSVIADTAEQADGFATLYFLSNTEQIMEYCKKYNTPVFVITLDNAKLKFCEWEKYEE